MFGGNENIDIKRVYYEGSDTLYTGQALCYNQDTTDNILNYSKSEGGDAECQTTPGTTAEGYQNEGKFLRVEKPKAANMKFLAGFVAEGANDVTGPKWIDIQVPNGAILLARGTDSFTIGDKVYIAAADYEITNVPQEGGFCGYAEETIDRSATEGLLLIKSVPTAVDGDITVVSNKLTAASPVAVTVADAGTIFTNEGAAGAVEFDLPTAASAKGCEYTFTVTDGTAGNNMAIDPNGSEVINFGNGSDVLGAGEALTLTPGDANDAGLSATIVSNGSAWVVKNAFGSAVALFVIP